MAKLKIKLIEGIMDYIMDIDRVDEIVHELMRYRNSFPHETDYNWYSYGNILPYYYQIAEFYKECGHEWVGDTESMLQDFKKHIRVAIDCLLDTDIVAVEYTKETK